MVVAELTMGNGQNVLITSDAPKKDGGGISFRNTRAEVNGKVFRVATRPLYQAWSNASVCNEMEFKNLYIGSDSGAGEPTLDVVTGEEFMSDNKPLVASIVCMERPY